MNLNKQNPVTPTFARHLGLFDATMIGVGAMIGAGIFVLTGIAAGESGPASILAFGLNGVVTLLTAFAYAELATAIPEAGGGYAYVRRAFPGLMGFTAGWMLWFAYTVACSLYALGFAGYFWEFFIKYLPDAAHGFFGVIGEQGAVLLVTLVVGILFVQLNARGTAVTGKAENVLTVTKLFVLGIFIAYGLKKIFNDPGHAVSSFNPFFPEGMGGVIVAMGLTFIAFEGYDLIATVAEEIKDPEKNIPKAIFISLNITIVMYLLILFVSLGAVTSPDGMPSWKFLGNYGETAIVRAAEGFMPAFGVGVIVFGGLLSTMSALNATVMASSRVAFSMGRDRLLPKSLATIHPDRRTPHIAIFITGAILLSMAMVLPIEAVGSAASLIFLLTFAMVNLSVIILRRKAPELKRRYKVPLYPFIPILAIVINLYLAFYQFTFQPLAWYVTIGWITLGVLVYYAYFEKQAAEISPQILEPHPLVDIGDHRRLVIPLHNPDHVSVLLDYARPIAESRGLKETAISVVNVPRQLPIHEGLRFAHHREALLKKGRDYFVSQGLSLETDILVAHNAHDGILEGARRNSADLMVMGWKGFTDTGDRIFGEVADQVIRNSPCDLILLKLASSDIPRSCLFPTAGGSNSLLVSDLLRVIAPAFDMTVTVCHVVSPDASTEDRLDAERWIDKSISIMGPEVKFERLIIEGDRPAGSIARASRDYELVALGAAKEPFIEQVLFGEIPEKVARYSPASVLVAKQYEGPVHSFFKRVLG